MEQFITTADPFPARLSTNPLGGGASMPLAVDDRRPLPAPSFSSSPMVSKARGGSCGGGEAALCWAETTWSMSHMDISTAADSESCSAALGGSWMLDQPSSTPWYGELTFKWALEVAGGWSVSRCVVVATSRGRRTRRSWATASGVGAGQAWSMERETRRRMWCVACVAFELKCRHHRRQRRCGDEGLWNHSMRTGQMRTEALRAKETHPTSTVMACSRSWSCSKNCSTMA
mmetsp:Transcript_23051/g.47097  ORF Transcript_23051/g.47097 Transcript_23051/m.47097 type:complete len:231 (-) Transcript_23051:308-1000(-)